MEKQVSEDISKLNKEFFDAKTKAIGVLYVDMDCFQNFKIGALLCLLQTEDEYKYMLSRLGVYNDRVDTETMKYFPDLKITEEDLNGYIACNDNHRKLVRVSPMTDYYRHFNMFGDAVEENNKFSTSHITPHLYIGCRHVKYDTEAKAMLAKRIQYYYPNWVITITDCDLWSYGKEIICAADHFSIYDMGRLFREKPTSDLITNGSMLMYKSLHAYPIYDEQELEEGETIQQLYESTELTFSLFCDFKYVDMRVLHE